MNEGGGNCLEGGLLELTRTRLSKDETMMRDEENRRRLMKLFIRTPRETMSLSQLFDTTFALFFLLLC